MKPLQARLPPVPRDKQENAIKAIEAALEHYQAVIQPCPLEFIKEQNGTVEYYNNRFRGNQDVKVARDWAAKLTKFMKEFESAVEFTFKTGKVMFKGT